MSPLCHPFPDTAINSEDIRLISYIYSSSRSLVDLMAPYSLSREADTKDDIIELNKWVHSIIRPNLILHTWRSFVGTKERTTQTCLSCSRNFPQIYELCWTCLNPDCYKFFTRPNGQILPDNLEYSRNFLELAPSMAIPVGFGTLMPAPVLSLNVKNKTTYAFTRGFHCNECGRLSCRSGFECLGNRSVTKRFCRYQWERWECRNCEVCVQPCPDLFWLILVYADQGAIHLCNSRGRNPYISNSTLELQRLYPKPHLW